MVLGMAKHISTALAATIIELAAKDPQAAYKAIMQLVQENKKLKAELQKLRGDK